MSRQNELVRIDEQGVAHPLGKTASQRLRARKGAFRLMPAPSHVVFMRYVGEDGARDEDDGAVVRLAGEVTAPGTLCDVVALIAQAGWRGELVVLDGQTSRSVFFEAGNVIGAQSSVVGERVGEVMYKLGALDDEQVQAVMDKVTPNRRFGETAVDLGFLTRERLFELMAKQTEEIVYASLRVADGMFWFLDRFDEGRIATRHHVSANALLMEGVRRMDESKYFRERIPSDEHVPVPVPGRGEPPAELAAVLAACDGQRSVADIGRASGLGEFEVTQALFQLVQTGFVHVNPPRPTGPQALVAIFNDAMRTIVRAAETAGKGGALREHLASFATSGGIYDALFMGAGPRDDGTLDEERIAKNIALLVEDDAEAQLATWLYEYVAFALFDAGSELPKQEEQALSKTVSERIKLLAPST